jgi:hypothetical protein
MIALETSSRMLSGFKSDQSRIPVAALSLTLLGQHEKVQTMFSQNGACLVGKMMPHPV